jgi:hypothetical protein
MRRLASLNEIELRQAIALPLHTLALILSLRAMSSAT